MTQRLPAVRARSEAHSSPRVTAELIAELAGRLTERDLKLLALVAAHRVLTTRQVARVFFTSENKARHRMLVLYRLGALIRFRPWQPCGSAPWHWVLGPSGARVLAAREDAPAQQATYRRDEALAICHSAHLGHQLGVNDFFTHLLSYARQVSDAELITWWSERRCAELWGDLARPDGYGRWTQGGTEVDFFLEHDTGSYNLGLVAKKLAAYAALAEATGIATPVLFWLPSARREANLRGLIGTPEIPVATAARTESEEPEGPAGRVWLPAGSGKTRARLFELGHTWLATAAPGRPCDVNRTPQPESASHP